LTLGKVERFETASFFKRFYKLKS